MKLSHALILAGLVAPSAARVGELYQKNEDGTKRLLERSCFRGNGYPFAKPVFTLNMLGKFEKDNASFNPQCNGNTCSMAVLLSEQCKGKNGDNCSVSANTQIKLTNGGTTVDRGAFDVVDADGTDGYAELMVADPFEDTDSPCYGDSSRNTGTVCTEAASYHIFARVRGKGQMGIALCFCDDPDIDVGSEECPADNEYCATPGVLDSTSMKGKATDITKNLLTVCADVDGDGTTDGVGLFDNFATNDNDGIDGNEGEVNDESYFWTVDNNGVRNAELRFFPVSDLDPDCFTAVTRGACV